MIHIAICDDNACFLQELTRHIGSILHSQKNHYTLAGFTSGEQLLNASPFDIVFLDIEMVGMDGMETARKLRERGDRCKLIFLTAHKKYVFSAFDVEAMQYLLKPLDIERLHIVLNQAILRLEAENTQYLNVKQGNKITRVPFGSISYIEVFDRKLFIHTAQCTYDFYGKLEELEELLSEDFFRCHRSYIVNLSYVRRYDKTAITLTNGETVFISKRKYSIFCKRFLAFLKKGGNPI